MLSCFLCETLTKTTKTQKSPHNSVKNNVLLKDSDEDGIFWGVAEGYFWQHVLRERVCEVGLVGGHLKTSIFSFFSFPFFLSFLFFFYINFGPAGPLKRERESWVWCGLFFVFDGEGCACNFNVPSFFGCAFFSVMREKDWFFREIKRERLVF